MPPAPVGCIGVYRSVCLALALGVTAALLIVPSAQARLVFPPPQTLSPAGTDPTVAVDSQDRATVAWSRSDGIQSMRLGADGIPGDVNTLARAPQNVFLGPQLALDPGDAATVVWERDAPSIQTCLQGVHVDAGGGPGEVHTLLCFPTPDRTLPPAEGGLLGDVPDVAVDSHGRATVVPSAGPLSVRLAPDGTPGVAQTVGEGLQAQVAVDARDRVTVVWRTGGGDLGRRVQAVRLGADGIPGRVRTLSKHAAIDPQVAVDPQGRATVVWRRFADRKPNQRVEAVRLGRDGKPGKVKTLSGGAFDPRVAVDRRGRATIVWVRSKRKQGTVRVQSVRLGADGRPGAVRTLSKSFASTPQVAVDSRGRATVIWAWGRRGSGIQRIQARRVPRRGAPEVVRTLSEPGQSAFNPQVAVDSQGRPTVVWWLSDGGIQSSRGDSP
jgi:hypothetical protein